MDTNNPITYEVYLECIKIGLVPNPPTDPNSNNYCVCDGVYCSDCLLPGIGPCQDSYRTASITYYPKALIENPEYLL